MKRVQEEGSPTAGLVELDRSRHNGRGTHPPCLAFMSAHPHTFLEKEEEYGRGHRLHPGDQTHRTEWKEAHTAVLELC